MTYRALLLLYLIPRWYLWNSDQKLKQERKNSEILILLELGECVEKGPVVL
jgi:hypothetical protein